MKQLQLVFFFSFFSIQLLWCQEVEIISTIPVNYEFFEPGPGVSQENYAAALSSLQNLMDKYASIADFIDPSTGEISANKSIMWSEIFTPGALVINDLDKKATMIHNADYADNVYEFLFDEGVSFDINDIVLEELEMNASGYIIAKLYVEKNVRTYIEENAPRYDSNGRKIDMYFEIEMPPYDIGAAQITKILGEIKEDIDKYSVVSLTANAGFGSVGLESESFDFVNFAQPTISNYGADILYRYGLGDNRKFFISIGIGAHVLNINTKELNLIPSTAPIDQGGTQTGYILGSDGLLTGEYNSQFFTSAVVGTDAFEKLNGIRFVPKIGVAYKVLDKTDSNLYLDFTLTGNYITNFRGGERELPTEGYLTPNTSNFPDFIELQDNLLELDGYLSDGSFGQNPLEVMNNFSYGISISPTYQYDININWGIEFSVEYYLGLSDLFKHRPADGPFQGGPSTFIEQFSTKSKLNNININIGAYYEFGKG